MCTQDILYYFICFLCIVGTSTRSRGKLSCEQGRKIITSEHSSVSFFLLFCSREIRNTNRCISVIRPYSVVVVVW